MRRDPWRLAQEYDAWFVYECHWASGQAADTPWGSLIALTLQADDMIAARTEQAAKVAEANEG